VTRFDLVTIDSPSPDVLVRFWSAALGLRELEREDGDRWVVVGDSQRRIGVQRGVHRAGGMHLDLACDVEEFDAEIRRLVSLGAHLLAPVRHESYGSIANMADPDGNPFDLCAYT